MREVLLQAVHEAAEGHAERGVDGVGFRCGVVGQDLDSDVRVTDGNDTGLLHAQHSHLNLSLAEAPGSIDH